MGDKHFSPVWKTHSPATLLPCAPKHLPLKALPSSNSKTASGGDGRCSSGWKMGGAVTGGAGSEELEKDLGARERSGRGDVCNGVVIYTDSEAPLWFLSR